jgi:AIR synthase-related protein
MLATLIAHLHQSLGILHKQDIQTAAHYLGSSLISLGDDCAAIPDANGYLLLASEGILPAFLEVEPWFAGWCAVMVNVSDIAAMGGRAIAVVDTIWSQSTEITQPIWKGMRAAAAAYNVPIVGGHTNCHSPYNALSVAILGRATHLITSFNARPGDVLLVVIDFQGEFYHRFPFWNAATTADPVQLQKKLEILPYLSEAGLCDAGKDISMGGIVGTLLMLLETSNCGAVLNLDTIAPPDNIPLEQWLLSFPSYGFLLSVRPEKVASVQACFHEQNLVCSAVGTVEEHHQLVLKLGNESAVFWDLFTRSLMGFSAEEKR